MFAPHRSQALAYSNVHVETGVEIRFVEPPEIAEAMAKGREDTLRGQFLWRLQARYAIAAD